MGRNAVGRISHRVADAPAPLRATSESHSRTQVARELLQTCVWLYQSQQSGLGPERVVFNTEEARRLALLEARRRGRDGPPLAEAEEERDVAVVDRVARRNSNRLLSPLCSAPCRDRVVTVSRHGDARAIGSLA